MRLRGRRGSCSFAGEPGVGKTRLAQEASLYAEDRGFLIASGRCYEQQRDTPFGPLLEAFGALHEAAPASVRGSLVERWPSLVTLLPDQFPSTEPRVWTSPDAAQPASSSHWPRPAAGGASPGRDPAR
ncbi:AAA family ATPase [Aeromicrobium sp. UC242_57]|uniref:AAA family ATPase n=1 Tax=Aeromicrobium sp. UC242_57 TaxID=3374624 RepID=UPI0037A20382